MQKVLASIVTVMLMVVLGAIVSDQATLQAQEIQSVMLPLSDLSQQVAAETPATTGEVAEVVDLPLTVSKPQPSIVAVNDEDLQCLARNIYFEARGEPRAGQVAVAFVTKNRVNSGLWRNSICKVVYQPSQFSWTSRGNPGIHDHRSWQAALDIAGDVLSNRETHDPSFNAVFFHNHTVRPSWSSSKGKVRTVVIGNHAFYKLNRG